MTFEQDLPTFNPELEIDEMIDSLQTDAREQRQRRLVWVSGDVSASIGLVSRLLMRMTDGDIHWHGDSAPPGVHVSRGREAFQQLGRECDTLVINALSGFDPDAFGALSGTLRGGGLLFLLMSSPASGSGERYLRRLSGILENDAHSVWIENGRIRRRPQVVKGTLAVDEPELSPCRTRDQQHAVEAVMHVVTGHRRRPVVLRSDRGRGKSAAFGIAAAALIRDRNMQIVVTAPRRQSVDAVFERAAALLTPAQRQQLRYMPPDALVNGDCEADLLLVDEAAAIPAPLLEKLLRSSPRVAFSTTVHGYEGTGRGFSVRFSTVLDRCTNSWKTVVLDTPVRWAAGDLLEPLVFRLLMLDATAGPDKVLAGADLDSAVIERVNRDHLVNDELLLRELFGLLVLAHYKTRPFDLRQLLDGSNISVYLLRLDGHVAAAALVAEEGSFNEDDSQAVAAGVSRPQGHLLPELLAAHLGLVGAPLQRAARVMRIAVHPAVQGRGLGSQLLEQISADAATAGFDYAGSSFGANDALLRFWQRAGWQAVRISERRGASSGYHSVVMLKPLSTRGTNLSIQARQRFLRHFPHQLSDTLRELDSSLVMALMRDAPECGQLLTADDLEDVRRFAHQRRLLESAIGALWPWLCNRLMSPKSLDNLNASDAGLLVARILQKQDWTTCARRSGLTGQNQAVARLRDLVRQLMN